MNSALRFEDHAGFELAPNQVASVEVCSTWRRLGNFSDVGTGKTVMSTATSLLKDVKQTIVAVPPILIPQWTQWLSNFGAPVTRYQGPPKFRGSLDVTNARWIVMSHAIFRQDFDYLNRLLNNEGLEVIVDEAHALKNPASVLYKCVARISAGKDVQLLTGTPTNKPGDAYAYIKIKTPEVYRSLGHFENVHVEERDFFNQPTKWALLDKLAENLAIQTVKFTKEEMFGYDLHPIYQTIPYDLEPQHLKLYERLVDEQLLLLDDGTKIDATTAQKLYHALQQIVCNWDHFSGEDNRSAVYDLVDEVIDSTDCLNVNKSKLIIWTHYKMTSRKLTDYLNRGHPGSTVAAYSGADAALSVSLFLNNPQTRILVAQPTSAGVGLNPAHLCSEMLFVEANTVPLYMRQAIGRVDRMGQKVRPTVRFASATGTIQRHLYDRLLKNDDLVVQVERLKSSLRDLLLGS